MNGMKIAYRYMRLNCFFQTCSTKFGKIQETVVTKTMRMTAAPISVFMRNRSVFSTSRTNAW